GDLLVRDANLGACRTRDTHDRGPRHRGTPVAAAARVHRRAGRAMRLLHRGHDRARAGAARRESVAERRRDTPPHGAESLPLRNAYADPAGDPPRREKAGARDQAAATALDMTRNPQSVARRAFLARSGALVVTFSLAPLDALAQQQEGPKLPGSLDQAPRLAAWIRVGADGSVTVFTGKAELGQGIKTALIAV